MEIKCCICGQEPKKKLADGYQGFFYLCSDKECEIKLTEKLMENGEKSNR